MLKILTLAVVVFTVILIHGAYGGVARRDVRESDSVDVVTTKAPRVYKVQLKKFERPRVTLQNPEWIRDKREAPDVESESLDEFRRGPLNLKEIGVLKSTSLSKKNVDAFDEPISEEFFRADVKGFEAREQEEKLAEAESLSGGASEDQPAEMTEGRAPTDDEKQRFDVESTSPKGTKRFEAFEALEIQVPM